MKILVAVEPADLRAGSTAWRGSASEALRHDPFAGAVFVFRNRRATALKLLMYDGQGFWLCHKRLSQGRLPWWPSAADGEAAHRLAEHQLAVCSRPATRRNRRGGRLAAGGTAGLTGPDGSCRIVDGLLTGARMGGHAGPRDGRRSLSSVEPVAAGCERAGARRRGQRPTGGSPPPRRAIARREGRRVDPRGPRVVRLRDRVGGRQEHHDPPAPPAVLRSRTETTEAVVGPKAETSEVTASPDAAAEIESAAGEGTRRSEAAAASKGHGRNGAAADPGAERIDVPQPSLRAGDACPACGEGTVYEKAPGVLVRITGQPPLAATVYQPQKLRCHLCGQVFTADAPERPARAKRRHGRQHDRLSKTAAGPVQPPTACRGTWAPAAGLDPVGHREGGGRRTSPPRSTS